MSLSLFDLHCDTACEMLRHKQGLEQNEFAVSLQKALSFQHYIQVMAHWTDSALSDEEGWKRFWDILQNLRNDPAVLQGKATLCTSLPPEIKSTALLLAVEDARILSGKLERVDLLCQSGVRILTPLWQGVTCIGGSHDTEIGLTPFGKCAVERAVKLGMIPDISHASVASADEIITIAQANGRPVIASHSNVRDICPVSRNVNRKQIKAIIRLDGLIGINLYKQFLKADGTATAADVLPHIDYLLACGAEKHIALGCDMDGCDLPEDLTDLSALPRLAELMLRHGYSQSLVDAIFYQNAYRFANQYIC